MKKPLLIFSTSSIALCIGFGVYSVLQDASYSHPSNTLGTRANDFTSSHVQNNQENSQRIQQQLQQEINQWEQQQSGQQSQLSTQQGNQSTSAAVSVPNNTKGSGNWAGYIDSPASTSKSYTSVSGSWTVPNISGNQNGVAAQWIGLGGVSSDDLLQMGTIEQFVNGRAEADVFWEKLPATAQNVMTVPMGSTINVSISKATGTTWNITFSAHTPAGQSDTKTIPVTLNSAYAQGIGTSAEWISEDPSDQNNNLYPLADMGTVTYSAATVNGQSLNSSGNEVQPVALVNNSGNVLIAPSAVGGDGESFSTSVVSTITGSSEPNGLFGRQGSHRHFGGQSRNREYPQYGFGYGFKR